MSALGRLHGATLELVKGSPIKQRLALAFSNHLKELDPSDLPAEMRPAFLGLVADLECVKPLPGESAVQATVRKMSPEQVDRCAACIVELYDGVARAPTSIARLAPRDKREDSPQVVPLLFAAEA
jgi:hypothetical protein